MAVKTIEANDTAVVQENNKPGLLVFKKMSEIMFESGLNEQDRVAIILGLITKMSETLPDNPPVFTPDQSDEIIEVIRDIYRQPKQK